MVPFVNSSLDGWLPFQVRESAAFERTVARIKKTIASRLRKLGGNMNAYRKEIRGTVFFFILYLLTCHTAIWSILFGTDNSVRVLGFPLHYFIAIVLGWFGVLAISIWWNVWADRLEREIAGSSPQSAPSGALAEDRS